VLPILVGTPFLEFTLSWEEEDCPDSILAGLLILRMFVIYHAINSIRLERFLSDRLVSGSLDGDLWISMPKPLLALEELTPSIITTINSKLRGSILRSCP